ncbi:MAG: EFR1 family ferrodoxin [Bacilli bacterium]|jgi:ferredoxin/flavodoxin
MHILFLVFSGTNNTLEIARLLAGDFANCGHTCEINNINVDTPLVDLNNYDCVAFGYPVYAFNEPRFFYRYIKRLALPKNIKYFIFKTSGETLQINNASSRRILRLLRRGKCQAFGDYHFVMPYNIHFRFDDAFVKEIILYNRKYSRLVTHLVLSNRPRFLKTNPLYNLIAWVLGIQRPGATLNSYLYRTDMTKCIRCLKCVRECPTRNIRINDERIIFGHQCEMCMRCSFYCPTDAISIGFLNSWRVSGAYDFEKIESNTDLKLPYITDEAKGFYRCFIKYFKEIDALHEEIFPEANINH